MSRDEDRGTVSTDESIDRDGLDFALTPNSGTLSESFIIPSGSPPLQAERSSPRAKLRQA